MNVDVDAAIVIPKSIAGYWRIINCGPNTIDLIFHPNINIRFIAKATISYIGIITAIGICIHYCHFCAAVKVRPPPWPQTKPRMKKRIVIYDSFSHKIKITGGKILSDIKTQLWQLGSAINETGKGKTNSVSNEFRSSTPRASSGIPLMR